MLNELISRYNVLEECREDIIKARDAIIKCYENGGKMLICGNGGSCADSDHIVGELMKGFLLKREIDDPRLPSHICEKLQAALPAISLPSQSAALTAFMNDVDPSLVYAQLLYGYARPNDLFLGLSTSGNSQNVVNAATVAKAVGITTVAMTGTRESKLSEISDVTIRVPECETFKIQELHLPIYHAFCLEVEDAIFGNHK